jgi:multiple sugar transport system substrate-binding protein
LTQWYHQYGEAGTQQAVLRYAKTFTRANVKVNWIAGDGNAYPDKVQAALLGNNPPDIFELSNVTVAQVKAGQLEPLDDLVAGVESDFLPADISSYTVDGHIYAIKMITDPEFVYYRKSLFREAGIEAPPKTIDELIAIAKKLSNGNRKGLYIGSDGGVNALSYIAGWSSGGDFLTSDHKVAFNTDRMAAAYEKLHELSVSGGILPDAPTDWWDPTAFEQGFCAMQFCGLWAMPGITHALGDDFAIFPWPASDAQGSPAANSDGWAEMVAAKGKHVALAKEFVKSLWITSTQIQTDWCVGYGFHVPTRKSIAAQTKKLQSGPAAVAVDILNKYGRALSPLWDTAMDTALTDAVSKIVKNGTNIAAQLNHAAETCQAEIQRVLG